MVQFCSIEYLPNIRQLLVLIPIKVDNVSTNSKVYLNMITKTLSISNIDSEQHGELLISVPGTISVNELEIPILGALVNFPQVNRIDNVLIIQFRDVCSSGQHGLMPEFPCAIDLQDHCREISCVKCSKPLKKLPEAEFVFKDLPNEHWLELLDCWSCHDNEFAPIAERALHKPGDEMPPTKDKNDCQSHSHDSCHGHKKSYQDINNSSHGLILPPAGKIYISPSYIIMNKHDFEAIKCPKCHEIIGDYIQKDYLKLSRDSILFNGFPTESFKQILMHRILDTIDNHSTFHFILKSPQESAYLRPLHWNLQVFDFSQKQWKFAFKFGFEQGDALKIDADVIQCTSEQFASILLDLQAHHVNDLFSSRIKIPGSNTLNLSYLIN